MIATTMSAATNERARSSIFALGLRSNGGMALRCRCELVASRAYLGGLIRHQMPLRCEPNTPRGDALICNFATQTDAPYCSPRPKKSLHGRGWVSDTGLAKSSISDTLQACLLNARLFSVGCACGGISAWVVCPHPWLASRARVPSIPKGEMFRLRAA
jgi:hypothetical protein